MIFTQSVAAEQRMACTLALEIGQDKTLIQEGRCDERISPASTFKIPISLMAFDKGLFTSADQPEWQFQEGYTDWIPAWRKTTTPASWMRDSVVWFSQLATEKIGQDQFEFYVNAFNYGNKDISGDTDKSNGLTNAWLSSSLQISPVEQISFLTRMIEGKLPVSKIAVERTKELLKFDEQPGGWQIYGKTGSGLPFGKNGQLLNGQPFGWYTGWAEKGNRTVVFAKLIHLNERPKTSPGALAREELINTLFMPGAITDRD